MDGNKLLSDVSSKYGAPMGRKQYRNKTDGKVRLFYVKFQDGCYDMGGAYWGSPANLYAAIGEGFEQYRRGVSREDVKHQLLEEFPDLKFYR